MQKQTQTLTLMLYQTILVAAAAAAAAAVAAAAFYSGRAKVLALGSVVSGDQRGIQYGHSSPVL